jgi:hypothetical protein
MKPKALLAAFLVAAGVVAWAGWTEVAPMPSDPSGKAVKYGAWLVYDDVGGLVYAAKGYKTPDFYCYNPDDDTWVALETIPEGVENRPPKRGCRGAWDGDNSIYMTKGANTLGFWRYDISGNAWTQMPDVPPGNQRKKVKGGTDMVHVELDGHGYVYLLKGYKQEFLRFNVTGDSWEALADAPKGKKPKWDKGSWLVFDGVYTIFAHKARHAELWTYDLLTGEWAEEALAGMPRPSGLTSKKKKSGEGSGAAWYDGAIYTTKGGNTCEFWMYNAWVDVWFELDTIPREGSTGGSKAVKHGGDLVGVGEGVFYALKGKKTSDFYRYSLMPELSHCPKTEGRSGITGTGSLRLDLQGATRVTMFDANGRRLGSDTGLRSGVYLVRAEFGDKTRYFRHVVAR